MAKKTKAAKASAGAAVTGASPYVQRLIQDEELRDNIRTAYDSGRSAYHRLNNGKAPAKALLDDKKLHKDLQRAADSLRDASDALREGPVKRKRRGGIGKLLLIAIIGGAVALGASSDLRNKVLDLLFGAEEEFDYTSTTAPSSPAPSQTQGAGAS
jgi:ferric-dicitrate binding protein FerR (iron transport regulator)